MGPDELRCIISKMINTSWVHPTVRLERYCRHWHAIALQLVLDTRSCCYTRLAVGVLVAFSMWASDCDIDVVEPGASREMKNDVGNTPRLVRTADIPTVSSIHKSEDIRRDILRMLKNSEFSNDVHQHQQQYRFSGSRNQVFS